MARLLHRTLQVAAVAFLGAYVAVALLRIRYPFELEWMEGAMADHVWRVLHDEPLYTAASIDWIPYLYPPLFYWCGAGVAALVGHGLFALRLVSFAASLGCCVLVYALTRRETGRRWPALVAVGLYAATFGASGFFFDLARVDSFFLFWSLLAIHELRAGRSRTRMLAAGLAMALAVLAKQTAAIIFGPVLLWALLFKARTAWVAPAVSAGVLLSSYLVLDGSTDGWFAFYVVDQIGQHGMEQGAWAGFWTNDLAAKVPVVVVLAAAAVLLPATDFGTRAFRLALVAGGLAAGWAGRLHPGGWVNVLMPAFCVCAIAASITVSEIERRTQRAAVLLPLLAVLLAQFGLLVWDPRAQVPNDADRRVGESIVAALRDAGGEVFVPAHGHLAVMAGLRPSLHQQALNDIPGDARIAIAAQLIEAAERKRYAAILIDGLVPHPKFEQNYRVARLITDDPKLFWQVTGKKCRPLLLYVPR